MVASMSSRRLTLSQARRTAIAAQGLDRPRPAGPVTMAHLQRLVDRLGLLQIDSVNVLARAHLLPVFARLGPYDTALLSRATGRSPRRLVEYWAHEASFVPPRTYRLLEWRMREMAQRPVRSYLGEHPEGVLAVVAEHLAEHGPRTARQLETELETAVERRRDHWGWNWSLTKRALERLFATGEVAVAGRNGQFERVYDLPERVLPADVLDEAPVPEEEAIRELMAISARAHGIGTLGCLRDYFRLPKARAAAAVADLVAAGELERVEVAGWDRPAFLHRDARLPRRVSARALLAPFDPLVFERRRLIDLFGMHYRIGIYTPAEQRTHGYYVLPFLLGEHLVARVDLKADRAAGVLQVRHAFAEDAEQVPDAAGRRRWPARTEILQALSAELAELARWQGLESVVVMPDAGGELAELLRQTM